MPNRFEVIYHPNKFRLKPGIWVEPETTTTEGFGTTTTEWPIGTTTTPWPTTTTTDDGIVQYVIYYDGITEWRKGVRDGCFVWDRAITLTGFDGIEDTDWENVRMLCGVGTTTTTPEFTPFMMTIDTTKAGSANDTFVLPTVGAGVYDYYIDWGDGGAEEHVIINTSQTHIYAAPGTYQISIRGVFPRIYFAGGGDRLKLMTIDQWGDIAWSSMALAFSGCANMQGNWADAPNLTACNTLLSMFSGCTIFNYSVSGWDTSYVINMMGMFSFCSAFNQPVNDLDVSGVTNMTQMFWNCDVFNQPVSNWDTSSCTTMTSMFSGCHAFNQSLANFDTSQVGSFANMLNGATSFRQSLASFSLASATSLAGMLGGCDINAPATSDNYDATLIAWAAADVPDSLTFDGGGSKYSDLGEAAKTSLQTDDSWTITDGGHI